MKVFKPIYVVVILSISTTFVNALDRLPADPEILLGGKVNCIDPVNGALASVVVFNITKGYGTITRQDGGFNIYMTRKDTIVFSTAEHKDYYYMINNEQKFENHAIEVIMITDAIWLDAVTIMGYQSLEQFKKEILSLDIPQDNRDLALPIINKYARQLKTGDGETDLVGPLTYLQNKFVRYYKMRQRVSKDINKQKK